jgi:hypothetical protein
MRSILVVAVIVISAGCTEEPKPKLAGPQTKAALPEAKALAPEQIAFDSLVKDLKVMVRLFDTIPTKADFQRHEDKVTDKIASLPDDVPKKTRDAMRNIVNECGGMALLGNLVLQSGSQMAVEDHRQKLDQFQIDMHKKILAISRMP